MGSHQGEKIAIGHLEELGRAAQREFMRPYPIKHGRLLDDCHRPGGVLCNGLDEGIGVPPHLRG